MRLLWLDLETTGLDPRKCSILEVSASVAYLTDPFRAVPIFNAPLRLEQAEAVDLPEYIRTMHAELLPLCLASSVKVIDAEDALLRYAPQIDDRDEKTTLAGASVHFDLGFIREHMPRLAERLSHRVYDTSAIKLFCQSLGMPKLPRRETHRAEADVQEAIDHAKACLRWLRSP